MKRKIFSTLFALVLVLSFSLVAAVPVMAVEEETPDAMVFPFELGGKTTEIDDYVAEWSTAQVHGGSSSVHLQTTGTVGNGDEARILIDLSGFPEGEMPTLGDIETISWWEYLVAGYPPHVDVYVDIDGNGTADDALVIEYAYNTEAHAAEGGPTYGAVTDGWYQTFSDDGAGPTVIGDTTNAWLNSGPPGPLTGPGSENFIYGTLAQWKAGEVVGGEAIDADTVVTALEIEVDNWIVQSEAYIDDIVINDAFVCGKIQEAVDAVGTDALIYVMPGEYIEDLVIPADKANFELVGAAGATIKGVAMTISTSFPLAAANIEILADGAAISGFTIQGPDPVAGYYSSGMIIGASDVEIFDNAFEVTNTDDDNLDDVSQGFQTYNKAAVPGVDISGLNIHDNTFTHLGIGDNGFEAMYINPDEGVGTITIADNYFSDYIVRGITTERSNTIISGNTVWTEVDGIVLSGIMARNGLLETQDAVTITGNTVEGFAQGVRVGTAGQTLTNITIAENSLLANDVGVKISSSADGVTVKYNNIEANTTYGVENADTANTLNAIKNFWGDISGPTFEGEGQYYSGAGDKVSGDVNFVPWLTRDFQTVLDDNISYFGQPMVSLNTGWNTLSTPVALDPGCDTWGEYIALGDGLNIHGTSPAYAFNGAIQDWLPLIGEDADYPVKPCDAIYVRMAEPDVGAILYSPEPSAPTTDVYQGWNLVGLASLDPMISKNALTSLYMVTSDLTGYSVVISPPLAQSPWTFIRDGSPQIMQPTRGYWVFMENGPDTLAGFTFTPFSLEVTSGEGGLWEVPFEWYSMTTGSADAYDEEDDNYFNYTLPWSFPFAGKEIVEIAVSSNGSIELLESGETESAGSDYDTMGYFASTYPDCDFIFAWIDDLDSYNYGFYGVEDNGDVVVVHWETPTCSDDDPGYMNYLQLWLFPDGSIQWNFKEFNYDEYSYNLETGIYESDSGILLNVAYAMGEADGIFNTPEKSYKYFGQYWP